MYAIENIAFFLAHFDPARGGGRKPGIKRTGGDMETLVGILAFGTLGFGVVFGYLSARATEKLRDSDQPKSALSRDGMQQRMARAAR
jgi:hypothetical protein